MVKLIYECTYVLLFSSTYVIACGGYCFYDIVMRETQQSLKCCSSNADWWHRADIGPGALKGTGGGTYLVWSQTSVRPADSSVLSTVGWSGLYTFLMHGNTILFTVFRVAEYDGLIRTAIFENLMAPGIFDLAKCMGGKNQNVNMISNGA